MERGYFSRIQAKVLGQDLFDYGGVEKHPLKDRFLPTEALEATHEYLGRYLATNRGILNQNSKVNNWHWFGRTDTKVNLGSCVLVGSFDSNGLEADAFDDSLADSSYGRLALLDFSKI